MLHCDFPLGRPLGRPGDAPFQQRVLAAAFDLLARVDVPVLVDFPEAIGDESDQPLSCTLPPRSNPSLSAGVDEALALRPAYERAGRRQGRGVGAAAPDMDRIVELVELFDGLAAGAPWDSTGLSPAELHGAALEVRA